MRHSHRKPQFRLYRFCFAALLAMLVGSVILPAQALAWKPTTHVFLGELALQDALDDGKITINRVNYRTGAITGVVGEYSVDAEVMAALQNFPAQYHAGILGPDAYPDIMTGQQVIHPSSEHTEIPYGSEAWLRYLWQQSTLPEYHTPAVKAFTLGYLTHAAGDMFGHTFINNFSGGEFAITPPEGPENAIKHILLEGYVDKRMDTRHLDPSVFNVSIGDGVDQFIYENLVAANAGTFLDSDLLRAGAPGTELSIPRIFSTLRNGLTQDIAAKRKAAANCAWFDFTCSAIILNLVADYEVAWRQDIDEGLRLWPQVSHKVAIAIFYNSERKADLETANAILEEYALVHLTSMAGAPDFIGLGINQISQIVDAITPDFLLEPIRLLKEDLLNTLLTAAIGMDKDQLKEYLTNPQLYFTAVMNTGAGEHVTLQQMNATYLHLTDSGFDDPDEHLEYEKVPAIYNTVTMSKLILLSKSEINRLLGDLGASARLDTANVMLGFIPSLDGSRQWLNDDALVFARENDAYCQIFMLQPGEEPINCSPVAGADAYTLPDNNPYVVAAPGLLANDSDPDGDGLTAVLGTLPQHGTVVLNADGSFTYTPSGSAVDDFFDYTVSDGSAGSHAAVVTLSATPGNGAPITRIDGVYQLVENSNLTVLAPGVLQNDLDPDGNALSALVVVGPSHGTLNLETSGRFTYTPDPYYSGVDTFQYKANDGSTDSAATEVGIQIVGNPNVIVANTDTYLALKDSPLTIPAPGLLANDTDRDGLLLTAKDPPSGTMIGGIATLSADGSFSFIPAGGYFGEGEFSYMVTDSHVDSNITKTKILIRAENVAPVAVDNSYVITSNAAFQVAAPGVLGNDWDDDYHEEYQAYGLPPTDPKIAMVVSGPSAGVLILNADGSFTYTPGESFTGRDSFTYQLSDGWDESNVATVRIAGSNGNHAPTAANDSYQILVNTQLLEPAPGVLANDTDSDGDPLTLLPGQNVSHGALKLNGDGSFVYSPTVDFAGSDSFTYVVADTLGVTRSATVTITVGDAVSNQAPLAADDLVTTTQGISVTIDLLANDADADGDSLTFSLLTQPLSGTAVVQAGKVLYTPPAGFTGTTGFSYLASDGKGGTDTATVTVIVRDPAVENQAPVAGDDVATAKRGGSVSMEVMANDSDADGDPLTLTLVTQPGHGTAGVSGTLILYTPAAGFSGADSFVYRITDDKGGSDTATVSITVVEPVTLLPALAK